ncbi:hypothetical protein M758_6G155500 [Ceratodon purpureus]|nr:hypothetical protein M758_6G155500 [Ceratodon purpureus]
MAKVPHEAPTSISQIITHTYILTLQQKHNNATTLKSSKSFLPQLNHESDMQAGSACSSTELFSRLSHVTNVYTNAGTSEILKTTEILHPSTASSVPKSGQYSVMICSMSVSLQALSNESLGHARSLPKDNAWSNSSASTLICVH